jgi:biopolymer transport protein ExbB/TolQ
MFEFMSFGELLMRGGPVFILLIACSVLSLAVIIERIVVYRNFDKDQASARALILERAKAGDLEGARALCDEGKGLVGRMFVSAIDRRGASKEYIEEAVKRTAVAVPRYLDKRLVILATLGGTTPFIGLFGTVLGIINAFSSISLAESFSAGLVANGIAEALLNTAAGLFVAVPAVVAYNVFVHQNRRRFGDVEIACSELVELIAGDGK